ncbi:MAG: molybdenum cofactor synthesis protein [Planctomycetes bacterium]|nr:molybdenum cofactor synthesis protein [Planctomycetota bacterium]
MSDKGEVVSVNISTEKGAIKTPVDSVRLDANGIVGDAHAGPWHRQVTLLAAEDIEAFSKSNNREIKVGEFAENITTKGIDLSNVGVLDEFQIGGVRMQVTQIGKKCHGGGCAVFQQIGKCVMPDKGIFCKVLQGGAIRPSETIEFIPYSLNILIITLSDRAFAGAYTDRSGPKAKEILEEFFGDKRWHVSIDDQLMPDDPGQLKASLAGAIDSGIDVIFTLGGTGIGPRDIAPETVTEVCEKLIPGIMENIRIKYGSKKPSVLLSRSVAGVNGKTQLYALPGSVRAVTEYLDEILKTLEHSIYMIHGLDVH